MRIGCEKLSLLLLLICVLVSAMKTSGPSSKQRQRDAPHEQAEQVSKKPKNTFPKGGLRATQECHHVKITYRSIVNNDEAKFVYKQKLEHRVQQRIGIPLGPFDNPPPPPPLVMDWTLCNETCTIKIRQFGRTLRSWVSGAGEGLARHCWNSGQLALSHREITLVDCGPGCDQPIPPLCQCAFALEVYSKYKKSTKEIGLEMDPSERPSWWKPSPSPLAICDLFHFSLEIIRSVVINQGWFVWDGEEVESSVPCRKSKGPPSNLVVPPETWCRCNNVKHNEQRQDCDHWNVECWREDLQGRVVPVSPAEVISAAAIANDEFDLESWQRVLPGLNLNERVER
ncbi:hypothetical protein BCR37DRAFT_387905 [Protomyces lactucae-debilis]|uniref:Uncharacterized protein n=1 Tax=Protomyces lactucae-debilis TaxID=2754530 RepID=A0A1Y2FAB6_PROLT|nr:uncharacterized protein BCR37DRAFT_387905 [Protomyces lactucae-debilis]ORY80862.1 hypothetical protein BCR37DRAFT_387905 [Protomyces lactucae-debilis]